MRREMTTGVETVDKKVMALEHSRAQIIENFRAELVPRITIIEAINANLQGKIWAIGAIWAVIVAAISVGVRFIGH